VVDNWQAQLYNVTNMPILQDSYWIDAWERFGGGEGDLFIYDADGKPVLEPASCSCNRLMYVVMIQVVYTRCFVPRNTPNLCPYALTCTKEEEC
jgi:hypothetical protein